MSLTILKKNRKSLANIGKPILPEHEAAIMRLHDAIKGLPSEYRIEIDNRDDGVTWTPVLVVRREWGTERGLSRTHEVAVIRSPKIAD